jgi:hypothetical protein
MSIPRPFRALPSALTVATIIALLVSAPSARGAASPAPAAPRIDLSRIPLSFEENVGQVHDSVRFLSRGPGYALYLTPSEAVLAVAAGKARTAPARARTAQRRERPPVDVLRMTLIGANPRPDVAGMERLPGRVNYFRGSDPAQWRPNVPTFAKVRYRDVYAGVDVVYHGTQHALEYDFIVAPGADPRAIALAFDHARRIELDGRGDLVLHLSHGAVRQPKPFVYQDIGGVRRPVDGRYVVDGRRVGFQVAAYDGAHPLVIDPVLVYSTYVGGADVTEGTAIAVDAGGNTYVTGDSIALDFPVAGPVQPTLAGNYDAVVMKLNASATALVYATYLGGSEDDNGFAIDLDGAGNAYVTGFTASSDFPTASALQPANGGGLGDVFVTRLSPTGAALVYSTYLGGDGDDEGFALKVDALGNARVAGTTSSNDFPTVAALQAVRGGGYDGFLARLSANGAALVQSTYLGGTGDDWVLGLSVDAAGSPHLAGATSSPDFAVTPGARQTTLAGDFDAFVVKLDATATVRLYSTYHGGADYDDAWAVAVDASGSAFVTGSTMSADFPTLNPVQAVNGGLADVFVSKLNATGSALLYSTYLGGAGFDSGLAIGFDAAGSAYVTGYSGSPDFPALTSIASQASSGLNIFAVKLTPSGGALAYSTFFGGNGDAWGNGIVVDAQGFAFITGRVGSDFPTTPGVVQPAIAGPANNVNAFVLKLDPLSMRHPGPQANDEGDAVVLAMEASGAIGVPITYAATGLPPALSINAATGVISGVLTFASAGVYDPVVTVTAGGRSVSTTFSWTVSDATPPANSPPVCTAASPSVATIWPPNHQQVSVNILGITDPDGTPVTITITRVLQDEPTNTKADGNTPIDGGGVGTSTAWVRAERSGQGNGRIYEIRFTATDPSGASCTGSVNVGVPHDQGKRRAPVDSGVRYDSTISGGPAL